MNLRVASAANRQQEEKKAYLKALLHAERDLPLLVARLSQGLIDIDGATARRWAGWLQALVGDPAWSILAPALHSPDAWPQVWHRARKAGFSDQAEHHQAIFFLRLFQRALDQQSLELARLAWEEALTSWAVLARSTYLDETVLAPVAAELSEDQRAQLLEGLLESPIRTLTKIAIDALHLATWSSPPQRRPLRFALQALAAAEAAFADPSSLIATGTLAQIDSAHREIHRAMTEAFIAEIDALDLSSITTKEVERLFDAASARADLLNHPPSVDRVLLRRGLQLIWDTRAIDRDEELALIDLLAPKLRPSADRLRDGDEKHRFGLEGAIADLAVFISEEALTLDKRQSSLQSALDICPGHRNASRMLSYLLLERANRQLLKTSALPAATTRLGPLRRRVEPLLQEARQLIERAESLHPENDLLEHYRDDLAEELRRFQLGDDASETSETSDEN